MTLLLHHKDKDKDKNKVKEKKENKDSDGEEDESDEDGEGKEKGEEEEKEEEEEEVEEKKGGLFEEYKQMMGLLTTIQVSGHFYPIPPRHCPVFIDAPRSVLTALTAPTLYPQSHTCSLLCFTHCFRLSVQASFHWRQR